MFSKKSDYYENHDKNNSPYVNMQIKLEIISRKYIIIYIGGQSIWIGKMVTGHVTLTW